MELRKLATLTILSLFLFIGADSERLISYPAQKIMGFRGLDSESAAPNLEDGRAKDLQNVKLSTSFDVKKRSGYNTINNTTLDDLDLSSPAITGLFDSIYSNGTSNTLAFLGNKIKYDNSGTWTEVGNFWDVPVLTASQNNLWKCIMALDSAICTNDVNVPVKISSTPAKASLDVSDLSDTLTKVKDIVWFRNYLVFVNTVENSIERPTRFRYSNVGTIETWSDDDFIDISTFGGDEIIGVSELYGDLYAFLKNSIWRISLVGGDSVFEIKKIIDGFGSVARDSIQIVQLFDNRSAIIFMTERKKVLMFNGYAITDIGERIQPTLDNLSATRLLYSRATFDGTSYYLTSTNGSGSEHNIILEYDVKINEWTKHTDINSNAFAQVEESTSSVKTYFGNYDAFVYWMDDPDLVNDVDGAVGNVTSAGTDDTSTITGAQVIICSGLGTGAYTGATIKITGGTAAAEEQVIATYSTTSVTVATAFSTTPDSSSSYTIGAIDSYFHTKWYDLGDSSREKSFLGLLFWAKEESNNEVTVQYAIDFGSNIGSETKSLSPSGSSLWDSALWDSGTWGVTGDKIYTIKQSGFGNFIQHKFVNNSIDKDFHLYGFNQLATGGDIKQ